MKRILKFGLCTFFFGFSFLAENCVSRGPRPHISRASEYVQNMDVKTGTIQEDSTQQTSQGSLDLPSLSFPSLGTETFGVRIVRSGLATEQVRPLQIEVIQEGERSQWLDAAYRSVDIRSPDLVVARGSISTPGGSVFAFEDTWIRNQDRIKVQRSVKVLQKGDTDLGFSSRFTLLDPVARPLSSYDVFVPSVWYRDNRDVPSHALASDKSDENYWYREDRLPLPLAMLINKETGWTLSIIHSEPDGATFKEEDGLKRVIDGRMKFGSLGFYDKRAPKLGFTYPGTEGERTGIFGMSPQRRWALRSHPVTAGFEQNYNLIVSLSHQSRFEDALATTWSQGLQVLAPKPYNVNLNVLYQGQIELLNRYWQEANGAPGFPFRIGLDGRVPDPSDFNLNMGFVGQQIANGYLMYREGLNQSDANLTVRGDAIISWWVRNSLDFRGCPRTWYDPLPQTWRNNDTFMREIGDGMSGLLHAWTIANDKGIHKDDWINFAERVADWLQALQNADGTFPRSFSCSRGVISHADTTNTSHVIPFLTSLYRITGKPSIKDMIDKAGAAIYRDIAQQARYVGGTPDNPNVPDKEAASMALRAFLALYDMDPQSGSQWLKAARDAASYYQTWVYGWAVPIPKDDTSAQFPASRNTIGLSAIATANNASDTYAAIDAFNFYRMWLETADRSFLTTAKILFLNSKQYVNWDAQNPLPNFGPDLLGEALSVIIPRGHGVKMFLPWQTYNLMEPLVQMQEAFGTLSIDETEALSPEVRQQKLKAFLARWK